MVARREVTLYAMTDDNKNSKPVSGVDNGNGTASLDISVGSSLPQKISFTDRSGQIGVADTAQEVMPANPNRKYLIFQNVSTTDMWINFNTDANKDQPSFLVTANGGSFVMEASLVVTDSVSVICAEASKSFTAKEA